MKVKFKQKAILALIGICACFAPNLVLQTCAMEDKESDEIQTNSYTLVKGNSDFIEKLKEDGVICKLDEDICKAFKQKFGLSLPEGSVVLDWSKLKQEISDNETYFGSKIEPCKEGYKIYYYEPGSNDEGSLGLYVKLPQYRNGGFDNGRYYFKSITALLFCNWINIKMLSNNNSNNNIINLRKIAQPTKLLRDSKYYYDFCDLFETEEEDVLWNRCSDVWLTWKGQYIHAFYRFDSKEKEKEYAIYLGSYHLNNYQDSLQFSSDKQPVVIDSELCVFNEESLKSALRSDVSKAIKISNCQ